MTRAIGVLLVLFFVLLSALNGVYLSQFLVKVDVFAALFLIFLLIAAIFNVSLALQPGPHPMRRWNRETWRYVLFVNLTTAGNWFGFFFAVKHIEPAMSATLINSVLPLATIGIALLLLNKRRIDPYELGSALTLLVAMLAAAGVVFSGHSGRTVADPRYYLLGVGMSFLCGVSIALNTVVSKKLNILGVSPSAIMACRFFLLLAISLAVVDRSALATAVQDFYAELLLVAVVGNLIPLFALQYGIKLLNPVTVVFINGLGPLTHLVVQTVSGLYPLSLASLASIGFSTVAILLGAYFSNRPPRQREAVPAPGTGAESTNVG
jgi:drug/metabolite transporter (DMT)-like permease